MAQMHTDADTHLGDGETTVNLDISPRPKSGGAGHNDEIQWDLLDLVRFCENHGDIWWDLV